MTCSGSIFQHWHSEGNVPHTRQKEKKIQSSCRVPNKLHSHIAAVLNETFRPLLFHGFPVAVVNQKLKTWSQPWSPPSTTHTSPWQIPPAASAQPSARRGFWPFAVARCDFTCCEAEYCKLSKKLFIVIYNQLHI